MGRWVTSKGRRIYIPDEGEKIPEKYKKNVDKNFTNKSKKEDSDEVELEEHSDPEYKNVTKGVKSEKQYEKEERERQNKDRVEREERDKARQIAQNKAERDKLNGKSDAPRYYTKSELEDAQFRKEALEEMKRYERNWSYYSAKEKRDISPNGVRELRKRIKEIEDYEKKKDKLNGTTTKKWSSEEKDYAKKVTANIKSGSTRLGEMTPTYLKILAGAGYGINVEGMSKTQLIQAICDKTGWNFKEQKQGYKNLDRGASKRKWVR